MLVLSLTNDLATVHYAAEIVGWEDEPASGCENAMY